MVEVGWALGVEFFAPPPEEDERDAEEMEEPLKGGGALDGGTVICGFIWEDELPDGGGLNGDGEVEPAEDEGAGEEAQGNGSAFFIECLGVAEGEDDEGEIEEGGEGDQREMPGEWEGFCGLVGGVSGGLVLVGGGLVFSLGSGLGI